MRTSKFQLIAAAIFWVAIFAASCGSLDVTFAPLEPLPGQSADVIATPAAAPRLQLPALPETGGARAVSDCDFTPLLQRGNASYASASNAVPDPSAEVLLLDPGPGEASWTIHAFGGFDPESHASGIELLTYDADDQTLYITLANYDELRWEFSSVELVGEEGDFETIRLPIADDAPYRSPTDTIYVAVISYEASLELRYASLYFGIRTDTWIQNIDASDDEVDQITISWDAPPEATGYVVYYRFLNFPGNLLLLTETVDTAFVHSATEPAGKEVIFEEPYMYFVAARFADGSCSQLTGYAVGVTVPPPPP